MAYYLGFEGPLEEMEAKLEELEAAADKNGSARSKLESLRRKSDKWLTKTYKELTPLQTLAVARHPERPSFGDYVERLFSGYQPLAGDRLFADNQSIGGGFAKFQGAAVCVIGTDKGGKSAATRAARNFGMAMPEGYRKAIRLMKLAEKFSLPIITLVDTPGAFPGVEAEQRGQSAAISACIDTALSVRVPTVAVITGEGGSGGAVALASANRVLMMEHSVYSVISPEGCASILWRDGKKAAAAAKALKITAADLLAMKITDKIIAEPIGGAHRNPTAAIAAVSTAIAEALGSLAASGGDYAEARRAKFLQFDGVVQK